MISKLLFKFRHNYICVLARRQPQVVKAEPGDSGFLRKSKFHFGFGLVFEIHRVLEDCVHFYLLCASGGICCEKTDLIY